METEDRDSGDMWVDPADPNVVADDLAADAVAIPPSEAQPGGMMPPIIGVDETEERPENGE